MPKRTRPKPEYHTKTKPRMAGRRIGALASIFIGIIVLELIVAITSMRVLGGIRAYIGGESLWAKSQKAAVTELHAYIIERDPIHFQNFRDLLEVNLGDMRARQALDQPTPDVELGRAGLLAGRNHPQDIDMMIALFIHLGELDAMREAIDIWSEADQAIMQLVQVGDQLHRQLQQEPTPEQLSDILRQLQAVDQQLTEHEEAFSSVLGELAREVESMAILILIIAVVLLGFSAIFAALWTYRFLLRTFEQRAQIERSLQGQQRLESLGRMAGGVAHDFNNLMTAVLGFTELIQDKVGPNSAIESELGEIEHAGKRATELTQKLLAFSRKQFVRSEVVDMNQLVTDAMKMLGPVIGENIETKCELHPVPLPVLGEASQLEQVLVNLMLNARDAMPDGGLLRLETTHQHDGDGHEVATTTVDDTGTGMDEKTRAHAFEPFFTTKPRGKGVGLGLSTAYGVIHQLGGTIRIVDKASPGCRVVMSLPLSQTPAKSRSEQASGQPQPGQGESIIVVEDNPAVLKFSTQVLTEAGYQVCGARSAEQALTMGAFDLLVTDLVLPGLNGHKLAEHMCRTTPELKVLYISGYPADTLKVLGMPKAAPTVLRKPFSGSALLTAVQSQLKA
ncbi:MAG: hypothetical protein DHS20C11_08030 [Lysobacteraceae bacterium]|nr:MAG: hypothetical protein DHS20C11_08030 [Xanthomonadaceae bacterium]